MKLAGPLLQVFLLLKSKSEENYIVGGSIRDYLLGKTSKDIDIVTDVSMDDIEVMFQDNGWKVDAVGKQFLVLTVSKNGNIYEIANFRKDGISNDGRRPESVEIGTLQEDAERRDFTINAIYYNPFKDEFIDPVGGKKDIADKKLKFIGKPKERIQEDYLRVFRFYRFLSTKGLEADIKSLKACRTYFTEAYQKTTPERVRNEIERMV